MVNQNGNGNALLQEFMDRFERMRKVTDTQEVEAVGYFADAARAHIMGQDGLIDYKQLDVSGETRQAMAAQIGNSMAVRAAQYNQSQGDLPWDVQASQTMQFFGTTAGNLKRDFDRLRSRFTMGQIASMAAQHKNTLTEILAASTTEHIPDTPAAISGLITAMNLTGQIDPRRARIQDINELLFAYAGTGGSVPQETIKRSPAYIPPAVPHA